MNHYPDGHNLGPGMVYDTPEEQEIARLTAKVRLLTIELAEAKAETKRAVQAVVDFRASLDEPAAPLPEVQAIPLDPTKEMIEAGAQRLVSWEDGSKWPDSWDALQVRAARNDAERVWRSMYIAGSEASQQGTDS